MKILTLLLKICLCFIASEALGQGPILITEIKGITFPDEFAGVTQSIVIRTNDPNAARFTATGDAKSNFTIGVLENEIFISTDGGGSPSRQMRVYSFKIKSGSRFNNQGQSGDIIIGATIDQQATNIPGPYSGNATLSIVYN